MIKDPNKLKILYIPPWFVTKSKPLGGIFFKEQLKDISKYTKKIVVLEIQLVPIYFLKNIFTPNKLLYEQRGNYGAYRLVIYRVLPKKSPFRDLILTRNIIRSYKQIVKQEGSFDLMHALSFWPSGYYASIIKEYLPELPFIITEHSSYLPELLSKRYFRKKVDKILKEDPFVLSVSQTVSKTLNHMGIRSFGVSPNFINVGNIHFRKRITKGDFVYLCITNNHWVKGIDVLLEAFRILISEKSITDVKLYIVGGELRNTKYYEVIKKYALDPYIELVGWIEYKKLSHFRLYSNCLVIPSRAETFGMAGVEAIASGMPVVTTACGGPESYVLNDFTGLVVKNEDPADLARGMLKMKKEYSRYSSHDLRKFIDENYDSKIVIPQLLENYQKIVKEKSK